MQLQKLHQIVGENDVGDDLSGRRFLPQRKAILGRVCSDIEAVVSQAVFASFKSDADPNLAAAVDLTRAWEEVAGEDAVGLVIRRDVAVEQIRFLAGDVNDAQLKLLVGGAQVVDEVNLVDADGLVERCQV